MRPLGGFTTFRGFSVVLEAEGKLLLWHFDREGFQEEALPENAAQVPLLLEPIAPLLQTEGRPLTPWEKLFLLLAGAALVLGGWHRYQLLWGSYFLLGYLSLGLLLRPFPIWGWHALEHKLINLLKEGGLPKDPEALRRALLEASPYAEGCGTLFGYALSLAFALLTPLLPLGLALPLGYLLAWGAWYLGLTALLTPLQALFLTPPRPWQVEAVVRGLAR